MNAILALSPTTHHASVEDIPDYSHTHQILIHLVWTPGHKGITGNKLDDITVKEVRSRLPFNVDATGDLIYRH